MTARRVYRNWNNIPFLSLPLTGPEAIAERVPVAGSYEIPDGRRVLVGEGEVCLPWAQRACTVWKDNIVNEKGGAA